MDDLDQALLKAWRTVSAELEGKPWKLARRMERVARKELRRPVRAWCVAVRASDRRISDEDCLGGAGEIDARCFYKGYNHRLRLTGPRLRELCKPVRVRWPGVPVVEAAALLGRDERTVWSWVKKGVVDVKRGVMVGPGKPKHLISTGRAMDPQADDGRGPWEVWGTLWQGLWEKVPAEFEQVVQRQTRLRPRDGAGGVEKRSGHYCGWDWVCPGRRLVTGQHVECGRVCKKLWLPLPAWTIGEALGDRAGAAWAAVREAREARGVVSGGSRGLACSRCWGLRFDYCRGKPDEAWNRFVSVVSGGLLYGREVDRPCGVRG